MRRPSAGVNRIVNRSASRQHYSATPPARRMEKASASGRFERALQAGDATTVAKMLDSGHNPDMPLRGSRKGLSLTVHQDDPKMFHTLLEHGASINPSGSANGNALFSCVRKEDVRGMNRVIAAGASAAETEGYVNAPPAENILFSVGTTTPDVVRRLLDAGAWQSLEKTDARKHTPLERLRKARAALVGETGEDYQPDLFDANRMGVIGLMERYRALPRLDFEKGGFSKADLFAPDATGNTPLDHPETWNRWPEVAEQLKKNGEKVSLADLRKTDAQGKEWIARAVECWSLPQVVDTLNKQGEKLDGDALMTQTSDGRRHDKPSQLFELAREHHQLSAVFNADNLAESPALFNTLFAQLNDAEKKQIVPNPHTFRAGLGKPSTQGIGR